MSVNRVTIMGNLGSDPELRATNETTVCTFSVATNEFYGSGADRKKHTEWHTVVTFGTLAQNCSRYLKRGSRVFLEGRLRTTTFKDKDGHQQSRTKVHPSTVQFLDSRPQDNSHSFVLEAFETTDPSFESLETDNSELA